MSNRPQPAVGSNAFPAPKRGLPTPFQRTVQRRSEEVPATPNGVCPTPPIPPWALERPRGGPDRASGASPAGEGKTCRTCKAELPLEAFAEHNGSRDGRRLDCRECLLSGRRKLKIETPAQRARRKERQARKKWQRSYRAARGRHQARFPKAARAGRIAKEAARTGRIPKPAHCQVLDCTETRHLERHHHDYDRPLEVLWACAAHHRRGHSVGFILVAPGIPEHYGNIPTRA